MTTQKLSRAEVCHIRLLSHKYGLERLDYKKVTAPNKDAFCSSFAEADTRHLPDYTPDFLPVSG